MPRTKVVAGPNGSQTIELTVAENAQRDAEEATWAAGATKRAAEAEISRLEGEVTPRRLRDALLTPDGKTWLQGKEDAIAVQRGNRGA